MGVLGGKIGEGVLRYWPPTNSFLLFAVLTSVPILEKIDQKMWQWECSQTDRHTDRQTDRQTQTDFIICPMLYAIAMGQIIIFPLICLRHPLDLTSTCIQEYTTNKPVTQDSNNNQVWHREVGCQKQTAPSVANSPIKSGLNLASTHQMAPPKHTSDYSVATRLSTPKGWKAELA